MSFLFTLLLIPSKTPVKMKSTMINERGHTPLLLLMEESFVGQNVAIYIQVGYEAKRHIHPLMKCLFWAKYDRNYSNISFDAPIQLAYFSILWESPGLMGPHTSYCQYFRVNFPMTSWLTFLFWNLSYSAFFHISPPFRLLHVLIRDVFQLWRTRFVENTTSLR